MSDLLTDQHAATILGIEKPQPVLPIRFLRVEDYTTFTAEFAVTEGDLVFHFYVTDEVNKLSNPSGYWHDAFAHALERTATDFFKAGPDRLKAAYTEEHASWWLRGYKMGMVLDPHKYAYAFLERLDLACDVEMKKLM